MGLLETADAGLTGLFGQWNNYSTGLVTLLVAVITYRVMTAVDPDVHPMLLARQSVPSTVRNEGESAIYRSQAAPHGMPLNSGLNVKDEGASKWSRGRNGDLRDVWRRAAQGGEGGAKGRILTVHGSENVVEHKLEDITRQINLIGQHVAEQGGIRVAIYLPNSVELLVTLLACSFYPNLTTVLIPFNVSNDELVSMLRRSAVDTVVTAPGAFPFDAAVKAYPSLRQLIWVVDEGSSHMDWNEVPEGTGGSVNVATWQDIIRDAPAEAGIELPPVDLENGPGDVVTFWQSKPGQPEEMVRFTQGNVVAGVSGQITAIPVKEKLGPSDLFLPADSLTNIHTLTLTLAALYANASVAFNSVAGQSPNLDVATQGVAPTVLVARLPRFSRLARNPQVVSALLSPRHPTLCLAARSPSKASCRPRTRCPPLPPLHAPRSVRRLASFASYTWPTERERTRLTSRPRFSPTYASLRGLGWCMRWRPPRLLEP